jgi:hypothetical protein
MKRSDRCLAEPPIRPFRVARTLYGAWGGRSGRGNFSIIYPESDLGISGTTANRMSGAVPLSESHYSRFCRFIPATSGLKITKAHGNGQRFSDLLGWFRVSFLSRGGNLTVTPLLAPSPSHTESLHHCVDVRDGTNITMTSQFFRSAAAFCIKAGVIVAL